MKCCNDAITHIQDDQTVATNLGGDWHRFVDKLGDFSSKDREATNHLTIKYCDALLDNLKDRFSEPEIVSAFSIFDPSYCPDKREDRRHYGEKEIQILLDRFGDLLEDPERLRNDWPALIESLKNDTTVKLQRRFSGLFSLVQGCFFKDAFPTFPDWQQLH